jgi:type I restriction enzyme, S subunit
VNGWARRPLVDLASRISDGSHNPPKGVAKSEFMMLSSKNVFDDQLSFDAPRYLSAAEFKAEDRRTSVAAGDVLLTIVGTIGRTAVVPSDAPAFTLQRSVAVIRPDKSAIEPRFLMYALMYGSGALNAQARGVAQKGIYLEALRDFVIGHPSLPDQRRIVTILDAAFEGIAIAKANAEKNLQNARELFESYAKSVFLQGAENWPTRTIDQISTNLDSKRVPITKSDRKAGEFPYYGASGIVDYVAEYIFEGHTLLISEDGANLLARSTPIAFSVAGRYWVNNHAHILKFDHMATQRFVEFYLESIPLDEYITGAAQPKLNQKALNSIPIPTPGSVDERAQVVDRLERVAEQSELLQGAYVRKLAALDELKKVLLSLAFTGGLTDKSVARQVADVA